MRLDYLSELYTPVAQVAERQHLRSASRRLLVVQLDTYSSVVRSPHKTLHINRQTKHATVWQLHSINIWIINKV